MILHYYEKGKRGDRVVLFIHGSASDASVWLNEINIIAARGYHCLAFDLRGHGETKEKIQPLEHVKLDIDTHIHDVKETLEYIGVLKLEKADKNAADDEDKLIMIDDKITIVTHSFGGIVAINIAEQYPELVEKLVLVALPPKLISPVKYFLKNLLGKPLEFIQANLDLFQKSGLRPRYKSSITTNAHVLKEIFKHVKNWNSFKKVPKLKCRIHFAVGRFDLVATASSVYKLHKMTRSSTYELFKWSSHALMEDEPEKFQGWLIEKITEPKNISANSQKASCSSTKNL